MLVFNPITFITIVRELSSYCENLFQTVTICVVSSLPSTVETRNVDNGPFQFYLPSSCNLSKMNCVRVTNLFGASVAP